MVTYLLGAGASAECVPVVEEFRETFISYSELNLLHDGEIFKGYKGLVERFSGYIKNYYKIIRRHPTVDIYAKELHLKGPRKEKELLELKMWLTIFYNLVQYSKPVDQRYLKLFASIFDPTSSRILTKSPFHFLTWNYDMQLVIAFSDFTPEGNPSLKDIHSLLRVFPSPYLDNPNLDGSETITITHLNGSANLGWWKNKNVKLEFHKKFLTYEKHYVKTGLGSSSKPEGYKKEILVLDRNILELLINYYDVFQKQIITDKELIYNTLTFCWEDSDHAKQSKKRAIEIAQETEILIIIGYSFPYVNRDVDDDIFKNLIKAKRIIIQDPMSEIRFKYIKQRLIDLLKQRKGSNLYNVDIEPFQDTYEFFLP